MGKTKTKITEISVNYGETWGQRNYSSIRADISMKAIVSEDDNPVAVIQDLMADARDQVYKELEQAAKDFEPIAH